MDLRRLRDETRREHEATEALLPLTGAGLTRRTYTDALRRLQPLLASWEQWAEANAPASLEALLRPRQRSQWIEQDLRALGLDGRGAEEWTPAPATDWQAVVSGEQGLGAAAPAPAAFLGAMYVVEGSTLGGRFIARHAEEHLGLTAETGAAYFRGHGEATGPLWRETTAAIAAVDEAEASVVIAAARRTFLAFQEGLRQENAPERAPGRTSEGSQAS